MEQCVCCALEGAFLILSLVLLSECEPAHDVIVYTPYGRLQGNRIKTDYDIGANSVTNTVDTYFGVPYAVPPVGSLRWQKPEPPARWHGIRSARRFSKVCPQVPDFHPNVSLSFQDEDCLYLNIYAPYERNEPRRKYPVMMWLHGGSYEVMAGKLYDGSVLAMNGVVVVTINYRLGVLGYLSSGDGLLTGNYGLLDQIQSLVWIRDNIANFRGDPSHVTVFGQSAGGSSIGLLQSSKMAAGLFHRVIIQSGSVLGSFAVHDATMDFPTYIRKVGKMFNCNSDASGPLVKCLRQVHWREFINKRRDFPWFDPMTPEFRPNVDGNVVDMDPSKVLAEGYSVGVPVMIGTVKDEFGNYFDEEDSSRGNNYNKELDKFLKRSYPEYGCMDAIRFQYTNWRMDHETSRSYGKMDRGSLISDMHMVAPSVKQAVYLAKQGIPVYQYHFTKKHSWHSIELNYIFGSPFTNIYADEIGNLSGLSFTERDKQYSRLTMRLWTNFAKYGNPTPEEHPVPSFETDSVIDWRPFDPVNRSYLLLTPKKCTMEQHLHARQVALWNVLLPTLRQKYANDLHQEGISSSMVGSQSEGTPQLWVFVAMTTLLLLAMVCLMVLHIKAMREIEMLRASHNHTPTPAHV